MNKTEVEEPPNRLLTLEFAIMDLAWNSVQNLRSIIEAACNQTLIHLSIQHIPCEISIALTDNAHMRALNSQFRNQDKPTNVLSFPAMELHYDNFRDQLMALEECYLGDIALSYETITKEAISQSKNFAAHLTHLVIHSILHLLGYDHEVNEDAIIMEALEVEILQCLAINNPYQLKGV